MNEPARPPQTAGLAEPGIGTKVLRDQIDLLFTRRRLATFSFPVLAALIAYALWGHAERPLILAWFFAVCAVAAVGIVVSGLYGKESVSPGRTRFWTKVGIAVSALNGLAFGTAGLFLYQHNDVTRQAFLVLFLGGICACAMASSSSYLPAYLAFVFPTIVPVIVRLALDADRLHITMSILTAIFTGFMVVLGRIGNGTIKQACALKHEKAALARELDAFAYSVSHDLRAPLRAVAGFSQALHEIYSSGLHEEAKEYLQRVRNAAQHMGDLIDDLLALSRVTRTEMLSERVDLSGLAQQVADELRQAEPGRPVEFIIAGGMEAKGDRRLLKVMLDNLLGNAWKFTGKSGAARIEVGSAVSEGRQVFFVRDNGAGFDMKYADKLFAPFQRLHGAAEFPGTGIGLSIVQRIAARHGGKVWCESAPGAGATFSFTLGGH
jgi:signal transduction histidine kinase